MWLDYIVNLPTLIYCEYNWLFLSGYEDTATWQIGSGIHDNDNMGPNSIKPIGMNPTLASCLVLLTMYNRIRKLKWHRASLYCS